MRAKHSNARRQLLQTASLAGVAAGFPRVLRSQTTLTLRFRTIPDPDGWHPTLRLKGDWLVFEISDGLLAGYGEASHSREDERCQQIASELFDRHYRGFALSLENLAAKESEIGVLEPDFVTATAFSGINQALYDLLAKREQVPVWQLFQQRIGRDRVPLYATINRALAERTHREYLDLVGALSAQRFRAFKCAPFESVDGPDLVSEKSQAGLKTLQLLRERFGDVGMRVDFHERFSPNDFFALLPVLESLRLDWIEEPFALGPDYRRLKDRTSLRVAAGELYWGVGPFADIGANDWADVIMPDVKHVGGFGPLLSVLENMRGRLEVSPHNPSGPISTAASLHAAVLFPDTVKSLEYAFDRHGTRRATGERVDGGFVHLSERSGWGVAPI